MRHRKSGRALGRSRSHRAALVRNQVTDLLRHEAIITTEAKAKSIRPVAEKMITLGKRGDLHARRQAGAVLTDKKILRVLFDEIAPRFAERPGGYTRIIKLGPRRGDGALMAHIELVERAAPEPASDDSDAANEADESQDAATE